MTVVVVGAVVVGVVVAVVVAGAIVVGVVVVVVAVVVAGVVVVVRVASFDLPMDVEDGPWEAMAPAIYYERCNLRMH